MLSVNTEPPYPHFFHQVSLADIALLKVSGDADISYVGFGPADLTPAPPVGFNLTFICPEGQVFDHDWFATPFLMMTCQVSWGWMRMSRWHVMFKLRKMGFLMSPTGKIISVFGVSCLKRKKILFWFLKSLLWKILATTTECFDCTTTSKYHHRKSKINSKITSIIISSVWKPELV